jgi:biopolymer transport protein ExbD
MVRPRPRPAVVIADPLLAEINITPLTDIFLVLLIIFMVSSTVISRAAASSDGDSTLAGGMKMDVSGGKGGGSGQSNLKEEDLSVVVLPDGKVLLGNYLLKPEEVEPAFKYEAQRSAKGLMVIMAPPEIGHGAVMRVVDVAKRAGFRRLAVGVESTE